jgi:transposase
VCFFTSRVRASLRAAHEAPDRVGRAVSTLIETAKVNGIDPRAWLADVISRISDHTIHNLGQVVP